MFSEQDVDRELKAALSAAPSPDFEARVLRRVAADRPSHWGVHYGWLAAAASIILVAGVLYALKDAPGVSAPQPAAPVIVEHSTPRSMTPPREPQARKEAIDPPRVAAVRVPRSAPRSARLPPPTTGEPEVIVPLNQMTAVRRLVRAVNEGRIDAPAEPQEGPVAPPETLAIVPIVVEPIVVPPVVPAETPAPTIRSLK